MQADWKKNQIEIIEMKTIVTKIDSKIKPQGMVWIIDQLQLCKKLVNCENNLSSPRESSE